MPTAENAPPLDVMVERARAYLTRHHCMSLATDGPEGLWAATVFYVSEGFELYFLSRSDARHVRNIDASPRVAATINEDTADWLGIAGVQLEGTADVVEGSPRARVLALFRRRFASTSVLWWTSEEDPASSEKRIYRVRPSRLLFIDHAFRDGRCEIPSERLSGGVTA